MKTEDQQLSTTTHWTQCLINSNDLTLEIVSLETELSIPKCLNLPSIAQIKKELPAKTLIRSVREIVMNTARTFKFSENMDLGQATILATDLMDYFRDESLEDIVLMFKMIRQGDLGSGKGRLDHDVIFTLFVPNYLLKKAEIREKQIQNEKMKKEREPIKHSAYAEKKFAELADMLSVNRIYSEDESKPVVNHHQIWINNLKNTVKNLSLSELKKELESAKKSDHAIFGEAVKIYQSEIEMR